MLKSLITSAVIMLSVSGCASFEQWRQQWLAENCNVNSAYSNGLADGLRSGGMPNNYGNSCPTHQTAISAAYLKGFSNGLQARPKEIYINQTVHDHRKQTQYH